MEQLVSIIIPTYNSEKYLDKCLDTITNQTYKNIEIIIINDGSSDNTKEKLKLWSKNDNRILVINKENEGVSIARNYGINMAKGKYIFFFDSDDTVELDCIEKIVKNAYYGKYDTVLYGYAGVTDNKIFKHKLSYEESEYTTQKDIITKVIACSIGITYNELNQWLQGKRSIRQGKENNGPWRMCYSTKIIKENNLKFNPNLKVGEDTIFTNEYLSYAQRVSIYDECLYYLYNHKESTIGKYLNNTICMKNNKIVLAQEKKELSLEIQKRTGINVRELWGGEVILSTVQIAWLLTKKEQCIRWIDRYKLYLDFRRHEIISECWEEFKIEKIYSIKAVLLLMIKYNMNLSVFLIMTILRKIGLSIETR